MIRRRKWEGGSFTRTTDSEDGLARTNGIEDGQLVKVSLSRIEELPATPGNELLGIWLLKEGRKEGKDILLIIKVLIYLRVEIYSLYFYSVDV